MTLIIKAIVLIIIMIAIWIVYTYVGERFEDFIILKSVPAPLTCISFMVMNVLPLVLGTLAMLVIARL